MWFKREQKNRRLKGGHVLDVKQRSDQVRAARTRLVSIALGVTLGTVFGLYLFWRAGEWALDKFVYENSTFAIQGIEVQTDGVIAPEQLRRWTNVKPGANLIALDLASVKRNLELVSSIDSVSVERVLPCTLKVRVTERVPEAQVNVPVADPALDHQARDRHDMLEIHRMLNEQILPLYYDDPEAWARLMLRSMNDVVPFFDADRMATEYYQQIYDADAIRA